MGLPLDNMVPFKPKEQPDDGTVRPYDCHLDTAALQELGINVGTVDFRTWWYVCVLCHCSSQTDSL
jgi:S-adenosylmethionine synthetase